MTLGQHLERAAEYRAQATEMLRLSERHLDEKQRVVLLDLARTYHRLAEQLEEMHRQDRERGHGSRLEADRLSELSDLPPEQRAARLLALAGDARREAVMSKGRGSPIVHFDRGAVGEIGGGSGERDQFRSEQELLRRGNARTRVAPACGA